MSAVLPYPPIEPYATGVMRVSPIHEIYWEASGNPNGIPVLIVHGGPGGSMKPYYRQLLDPDRFRLIGFDQRGCGRSRPFGELQDNSTQVLVQDMESLRKELGLPQWYVLGGSWGSTLALCYAVRHTQRLLGLVVSGVHLARQVDRDWWWGLSRYVYPDAWRYLRDFLPAKEREELREAYLRRVLSDDPHLYIPAGLRLMLYEARLLEPQPNDALLAAMQEDVAATVSMARLFCHFDKALGFIDEGEILDSASVLQDIPGAIIAGRSDMCTPPLAAWDLSACWPRASFHLLPMAGHRWDDRDIASCIGEVFDRLIAASAPIPQ
jgi:proline iminopeptidase